MAFWLNLRAILADSSAILWLGFKQIPRAFWLDSSADSTLYMRV
ncbi:MULTISPECIES: hypothetical protein [unclassified Helicobacter]|nr:MULTISPECIES: hypothetical protein [unclassified Helicobacter]